MGTDAVNSKSFAAASVQMGASLQNSAQNSSQVSKAPPSSAKDSYVSSKPPNDLALYGKTGRLHGAAGQMVSTAELAPLDVKKMDDEIEVSRIQNKRMMYEIETNQLDLIRMQHEAEMVLLDTQAIQQQET